MDIKTITWIEELASNAKWFVTLTFNRDVSRSDMQKTATAFRRRVSIAVAGSPAKKGAYNHQMVIVAERQPLSRRWHLHILMADIPPEYIDRAKRRGKGIRAISAKVWNSLRGTGKTNMVGGESMTIVDGVPVFQCEWFKPITDLRGLISYVGKTYKYQGNDFLVL